MVAAGTGRRIRLPRRLVEFRRLVLLHRDRPGGRPTFRRTNAENGRLRDHRLNDDSLRLLKYVGKNTVVYLGELRIDSEDPWLWRDGALDRFGATRRVIEFRLLPVGDVLRSPDEPTRDTPAQSVIEVTVLALPRETEVESLRSVLFHQVIAAQRRQARRREQELVHAFVDWLVTKGVAACGLEIPYAPERRSLRVDLYLSGSGTLIEAKASASRESLRAAIGQLFDYQRWVQPPPNLCVLLPSEAPDDMTSLLDSLSIGTAWPTPDGFLVRPDSLLQPWIPIDPSSPPRRVLR